MQPNYIFWRYVVEISIKYLKISNMTKILKVIKPFFVMDVDDTFQFSEEDGVYVSSYSVVHNEDSDKNNSVTSSYSSEYRISPEYAESLIAEGYLEEVTQTKEKDSAAFVNVFDEIEDLVASYKSELSQLNEDFKDAPACLKLEKQTVLTNLITVLNHLYSLKK